MKISVLNNKGEETGRSVDLQDSIFNVEPNEHAVYLDVKQYLANQRQGTHKTKVKGEITGSTRKIKKQKGTGGARAGSIKSGTIRGGGTMFGPQPRDYSFKLNKKVKQLARKSALSSKANANQIKVLEDQNIETPKTKEFVSILNNFSLSVAKTLIVVSENNTNVFLSARNIPNAKVVTVDELTTYDLVHTDHIVLFESAVETLHNRMN